MERPLEIHGGLLARNTALNLMGQALPLLVGLATIPYVVRGLGTESFGILSIAWVLLGYFSLFDLGLGRATTKFVAEYLGHGQIDQLPGLVWTSLGIQVLFGVAGTLLVGALTPFLVDRVLKVPASLVGETKVSFLILAASLPIVLATNGLRGVLEAAQRFDLVNYIRLPANASVFLLPAIALPFGLRLRGIVVLLVASRVVATFAYLAFCFRVFPALRHDFRFARKFLRPLAGYGGWVMVSNVVGPFLTYIDRFFIGALLSMAAVTYYTAPYEAITRVWVFPASLVTTLFPAFTALDARGLQAKMEDFYARSAKCLLLFLGPMLLLVIMFARQILRLWLGPDFASASTPVLQLLALGVLVNSLAFIPFHLLQAVGRPDLTAAFHLGEVPLYAVSLWYLLTRMGISGVALAWTLRVSVDAALLFGSVAWLRLVPLRGIIKVGLRRTVVALLAFGTALALLSSGVDPLLPKTLLATVLVAVFALAAWRYLLDTSEKRVFASVANWLYDAVAKVK
jgi:O-antigen/teichoic acid export membrane protein